MLRESHGVSIDSVVASSVRGFCMRVRRIARWRVVENDVVISYISYSSCVLAAYRAAHFSRLKFLSKCVILAVRGQHFKYIKVSLGPLNLHVYFEN